MKLKQYGELVVVVVGVLVLLAAAAWYGSQPDWKPMPESLTTLPDVDRSQYPLGPFTMDFSGIVGGSTDGKRATFYVVIRPGDVHLQHIGEVGRQLEGAAVMHVGIRYLANRVPPSAMPVTGPMVDGLLLHEVTIDSRPEFHTPNFQDGAGQPIWIICSLFPEGLGILRQTNSFRGISAGMCTATFRPRPHLHAFMGGIQPISMPHMATFLPQVHRLISERIQGAP